MSDEKMVEIEIDGQKVEVAEGSMIIQAADEVNIRIPRFCYHKKLSVAANCRMCLVDVAKAPKPLPACATPVMPGMVINTQSELALEAQRSVMEFLLINHPLDCPICDQGGECELQDVAMGYGEGVSRYSEKKRVVKDKNIGSLVATDMTRCIHCTRCVRFGEEIAGIRELGGTGRGEHTEIGTYIERDLISELSGNVIDLCPVGALTSKPFRFKARAWELEQTPSVAAHDCVGSNTYVHHRRDEVMRVVPRENESLNEVWLSDRDRFSYEGIASDERVTQPMINKDGKWQTVDWQTALLFCVERLKSVTDKYGADKIGALTSPNSSVEEMFLLQKLMRAIGTHNIDHRLRESDFSDQANSGVYPGLPNDLAALQQQQAILLVGSDIQREQPIIGHRIRQASLHGAEVMAVNPLDFAFNFELTEKCVTTPAQLPSVLAGIAKALSEKTSTKLDSQQQQLLDGVQVDDQHRQIAERLIAAEQSTLLLGALAQHHPHAATLRALSGLIADLSQSQQGILTDGCNASGAWLAGAIPHRSAANLNVNKPGLNAKQMWENKLNAYCLLNVEPELDCADPQLAMQALKDADFVMSLSPFKSELQDYVDIVLPTVPFTETSGTIVNAFGQWQSFTGVTSAFEQARPAWKILRVLGNLLKFDGFEYESSQTVFDEVKQLVDAMAGHQADAWQASSLPAAQTDGLQRIAVWPIYRVDSLVRRAPSLQNSGAAETAAIRICQSLAERLKLQDAEQAVVQQGEQSVELPLLIDSRVPDNCVYVPAGFTETRQLGSCFGQVSLQRSDA